MGSCHENLANVPCSAGNKVAVIVIGAKDGMEILGEDGLEKVGESVFDGISVEDDVIKVECAIVEVEKDIIRVERGIIETSDAMATHILDALKDKVDAVKDEANAIRAQSIDHKVEGAGTRRRVDPRRSRRTPPNNDSTAHARLRCRALRARSAGIKALTQDLNPEELNAFFERNHGTRELAETWGSQGRPYPRRRHHRERMRFDTAGWGHEL